MDNDNNGDIYIRLGLDEKEFYAGLDRAQSGVRALTESVQQVENGLQQHNMVFEKPEAVPEQLHAVPEKPEGTFENPEVSVFENPEAEYIEQPDVPVENPEPVIQTGDDKEGILR